MYLSLIVMGSMVLRTLRPQACRLCELRLAGCRDPPSYITASPSVHALPSTAGHDSVSCTEASTSVCPLCLGLLERPRSLLESIASGVEAIKARYEIREDTGFALDVFLPAATAVRARALQARGLGGGDTVDLKQAVRWVYIPLLEEALGTRCDPEGGLRVTLACTDAAGEGAWLAERVRQQAGRLPKRKKVYGQRRHPKAPMIAAGAGAGWL